MINENLRLLAQEAMQSRRVLIQIQSESDDQLRERGLDEPEILAVREGFLERVIGFGIPLDGSHQDSAGCCGG